jgi:hypothetical protein
MIGIEVKHGLGDRLVRVFLHSKAQEDSKMCLLKDAGSFSGEGRRHGQILINYIGTCR